MLDEPRVAELAEPVGENARGDAVAAALQLAEGRSRLVLARGIAGWGSYYLSRRSALTLRERELVIDRTTALCGADYEWGVHIAFFAEKAGLTDELHGSYDLSEEAWAGLVDAVGEDGAVEVALLCGWYHAISFAVRASRLPQEAGTPSIGPS